MFFTLCQFYTWRIFLKNRSIFGMPFFVQVMLVLWQDVHTADFFFLTFSRRTASALFLCRWMPVRRPACTNLLIQDLGHLIPFICQSNRCNPSVCEGAQVIRMSVKSGEMMKMDSDTRRKKGHQNISPKGKPKYLIHDLFGKEWGRQKTQERLYIDYTGQVFHYWKCFSISESKGI